MESPLPLEPVKQDEFAVGLTQPSQQPFLFDEVDLGCELLTIEQDRAANKHTGTTLERRSQLLEVICLRLADGVSIREVCRIYGVGRNTVAALVKRLEDAGKMEPYKKRMARKMGSVVEMGTDLLLERIAKGEIPTNVLPIAIGVVADKKALLEGDATLIIAGPKVGLDQAAWDRLLADLPAVKEIEATVTPVDPQSTVTTEKAQ